MINSFHFAREFVLAWAADCALVGITPDWTLYVDELDSDGYVRHQQMSHTGEDVSTWNEREGESYPALPPTLLTPQQPTTHPLNQSGARWRGLRESERVAALAQSLTIMQKMTLLKQLSLDITPMQLLGSIESRVLSETTLTETRTLVCRRVRLAYALPDTRIDDDGLPYDYDSVALHVVHSFDTVTATAPDLTDCLGGFAGVALMQPKDCLFYAGRLLIADASDGSQPSRVLVFTTDDDNE